MATDFLERCDVIEECYEFLLGYAAQGLPTDEGSSAAVKFERLQQAREALIGLAESCRRAIDDQQLEPRREVRCVLFHAGEQCKGFPGSR